MRDRFPRSARLSPSPWLLAPVAAVAGALTHVVWDAFTHPGRWGVNEVTWLREDHLGLAGHRWAQYLSGVLGLAVVVVASVHHVRSRSIGEPRAPRLLPSAVLPLLVAVGLTLVCSLWGVLELRRSNRQGPTVRA